MALDAARSGGLLSAAIPLICLWLLAAAGVRADGPYKPGGTGNEAPDWLVVSEAAAGRTIGYISACGVQEAGWDEEDGSVTTGAAGGGLS